MEKKSNNSFLSLVWNFIVYLFKKIFMSIFKRIKTG